MTAAVRYRIAHTTRYEYADSVALAHNVARVTPRDAPSQRCRRTRLTISPAPAVRHDRTDYFGNPTTFFAIQEPHRTLVVTAEHEVEVTPPVDLPATGPAWEEVRQALAAGEAAPVRDAYQFVFPSRYVPAVDGLAGFARPSFPPGRSLVAAVLDLTERIHRGFVYDPRATTVSTPVREVLQTRRGVCQDFAHLQIACLRSLGLAARYVSGYLRTAPPPGRPRLVGADASHAWVSVFCPQAGWFDVDPTNNLRPTGGHVLLGWGRDYDDVCPVKGVILGGGRHTLVVSVDVAPVVDEVNL